MSPEEFIDCFKRLTGNAPFPWQEELYRRFAQVDIPPHADLPTGFGKTSVVAVWLIALAFHPKQVPRRLVYVVNRRTVVDQTTTEVEKLRDNLAKAGLEEMNLALRELCALPLADKETPLAVSTLRGALAEDRAWCADPCRPAVVVGTVDLIGSRLLFSGYRATFRMRPLYAGFLGQDTLIVHDEAHLEPAFQELLTAIEKVQKRDPGAPERNARPVRVMQLTATTRGAEPGFSLTSADEMNSTVMERLHAHKHLVLHSLDDPKRLADKLAELALRHRESGRAILIFARLVETVEKVAESLRKQAGSEQVQTLTGTMRGKERDALVDHPVFRRFLPPPKDGAKVPVQPGTVFLVCTSAGEVGLDISADHLACDQTSFESMAQRLGRVNRFGGCTDTEVDVVYLSSANASAELQDFLAGKLDLASQKEEKQRKLLEERALVRTLALLERLNGDASPAALRRLDATERSEAFSAPPPILPTSRILFDAWALTSIRQELPGRPKVEPYLHGAVDPELPTTEVAWREEVGVITGDWLAKYDPMELLADYPLKSHELVRDRADRVWRQLEKLAQRKPDDPVWIVGDEDKAEIFTLSTLVAKREREKTFIDYRTVLLSPATGGLSDAATLDGGSSAANDVADWVPPNAPQRRRRGWDAQTVEKAECEGMQPISTIDLSIDPEEEDILSNDDEGSPSERVWRWFEIPALADSERPQRTAKRDVLLTEHTLQVQDFVGRIVDKLGLDHEMAAAIWLAAAFHDLGKRRSLWQNSIGNDDMTRLLAKPGKRRKPRNFTFRYRHEFGSLLDVLHERKLDESERKKFAALTEEMRDLALHLIATHHGRARPHFSTDEKDAIEHSNIAVDAKAIISETPRRFARLQRRHGHWGLAFLESLLRAADYAASAKPDGTEEGSR